MTRLFHSIDVGGSIWFDCSFAGMLFLSLDLDHKFGRTRENMNYAA